ncbi:MAG: hypothetical protein Q4G71_10000 [Pseudomonadota bacterium]|nr:hypothetical protein [Pseudomonadota bacterium]
MLKLKKVDTVALPVDIRLPTEKPGEFNTGKITAHVRIRSRDQVRELTERELSDEEVIRELVTAVDGLGDAEGNPVTGDAAIAEVTSGAWSNFLTAAILQAYFDQYGEARVKNSAPSRRR